MNISSIPMAPMALHSTSVGNVALPFQLFLSLEKDNVRFPKTRKLLTGLAAEMTSKGS
jgi:hypothetical protein